MAYKHKEPQERQVYAVMARNWLGFMKPVLEIKTNLAWPPERFWRIARGLGGTRLEAVG